MARIWGPRWSASQGCCTWDSSGTKITGTWETVFGRSVYTDELFMAWYFARYAERVTRAGKAEYPLPMFVNAALIRPGYLPGRYVSAGPLPHLIDVWRAAAPSIDLITPDIYFPNFVEWADKYTVSGNPLFIQEARFGPQSAVHALYAFGARDAIGFSPFAIESVENPERHPLARSWPVRILAPFQAPVLRQVLPLSRCAAGSSSRSRLTIFSSPGRGS